MDDLRLPFKLRWAGEPMPDISEFAEPLVISFGFRRANPGTSDDPLHPGDSNDTAIGRHHQPDLVLSTG